MAEDNGHDHAAPDDAPTVANPFIGVATHILSEHTNHGTNAAITHSVAMAEVYAILALAIAVEQWTQTFVNIAVMQATGAIPSPGTVPVPMPEDGG
jgi:hypothetical protein